jgi:hypothetical protein
MQLELNFTAKPTLKDKQDFGSARYRILQLLSDGRWHGADEVIFASGQREGLRRLRELRKYHNIMSVRGENCRTWFYKLEA